MIKVLHDRVGGATDNLHATYLVTAAELGSSDPSGEWSLRIQDQNSGDTGTLDYFLLDFHPTRH